MIDTTHYLQRYEITKKSKKSKFTPVEDEKLRKLVSIHGVANWSAVALELPGRSARQCRDRYSNYLDPGLNTNNWKPEEDHQLLEKYMSIGPHWRVLKDYFPFRSINSVRNRVLRLIRKGSSPQEVPSPTDKFIISQLPEINTANHLHIGGKISSMPEKPSDFFSDPQGSMDSIQIFDFM